MRTFAEKPRTTPNRCEHPGRACAPKVAAHTIPGLQRAIGNRAVSRLLEAGSRHEQEADRVAAQVMSGPAHACEPCRAAAPQRPDRAVVARKADGPPPPGGLPASVVATLHAPGHELDAGARTFMEERFGADFEGVRVHTDARAARSAADVHARAYTVGRHVVFGQGEYAPHAHAGRGLIAHELTHVLQQAGGRTRLARQARPEPTVRTPPPSAPPTMPRPPGIPADASVILQPINLPATLLAKIPEGKPTLVVAPNPPILLGRHGVDPGLEGLPVTAVGAATVENVAATLTTSGFVAAPGGNAIGMIGFPGKGLGWGHTAVYVRIDGKIVVTRGFMPASSLEALMTPGAKAGTASIPGRIANDASLFLRDNAQVIEYPVAKDVAMKAAADLPKPGVPPESFAQEYTARPGVKNAPGATNCVGFGCEFIESRLGGKVGAEKLGPVMEPANPATEGLQGRFMKASGEGPKGGPLLELPEATGPAVRGGMPRSFTVLKWGGRAFLVVGGVIAIVTVVRAPEEEKAHVAAVEGGGFLAGFAVGATAGLFCGPGALVCSIVLGLGFGIAGTLAGREVAEVIYDEAVGDDEAVRTWLGAHDRDGLRRQTPATKIQMILALLSGWISGEDVAAIDQICRSVDTAAEANVIRAAIEPRIVGKMKGLGQRTEVRVSLSNMPR